MFEKPVRAVLNASMIRSFLKADKRSLKAQSPTPESFYQFFSRISIKNILAFSIFFEVYLVKTAV